MTEDINLKENENQENQQSEVSENIENEENEEVETNPNSNQKVIVEEFKISPESLFNKFQELLPQNNIRRIVIKNSQGDELLAIPVDEAIRNAILLPTAGALGGLGLFLFDKFRNDLEDPIDEQDLWSSVLVGGGIVAALMAITTVFGLGGAMLANLSIVIEKVDEE
jgi:hypothetical protein